MQQDTEQERRAVVSAGEGLIPTHLVDALAEGRAHDPFSHHGPHTPARCRRESGKSHCFGRDIFTNYEFPASCG